MRTQAKGTQILDDSLTGADLAIKIGFYDETSSYSAGEEVWWLRDLYKVKVGQSVTGGISGDLTYSPDLTSADWEVLPRGVSTLTALSDTNLTSLANAQYLRYNSSAENWVNTLISASELQNTNTAFNKSFGTTSGTVSEGDHSHARIENTATTSFAEFGTSGADTHLTIKGNTTGGAGNITEWYDSTDTLQISITDDGIIKFSDSSYINLSGSPENLTFTDPVSGTKTLAELLAGGGSLTNRIENSATTSYLEFGTSGADAFATLRTSSTTIGDKLLVFENGTPAEIRYFDVGGNIIDATYNLLGYYGSDNLFLGHAGVIGKTDYTGAINNIAIGPSAMDALNTGDTNIAIGSHALGALTLGNFNIAIGPSTGISITDEQYTINIGYQTDATGLDSIAIGRRSKGIADYNIGIGAYTNNVSTGTSNVSIGFSAKRYGAGGAYNVSIGNLANSYGTGDNNVVLGHSAAANSAFTGQRNVLVGTYSGYALNAGSDDNIFIGPNSGFYETSSDVFLLTNQAKTDIATHRAAALMYGWMNATTANQTLLVNAKLQIFNSDTYLSRDGSSNLTFTDSVTGTKTLAELLAGSSSLANRIENTATTSYLEYGTSGNDEFLTGHSTLTGDNSIFILENSTSVAVFDVNAQGNIYNNGLRVFSFDAGNNNLFIGDKKANDTIISTADKNVGIGTSALLDLTTGDNNTAVGYFALTNLTEGLLNTAFGYYAGDSITTGRYNVAVGANALNGVTTTYYNIAIGYNAGLGATGTSNVLIGSLAADDPSFSGNSNVIIGPAAGNTLTTDSYTIGIGPNADPIGDYAICLGASSGASTYSIAIGAAADAATPVAANHNISIGRLARTNAPNGTHNIALGFEAGYSAAGDNNIVMGQESGRSSTFTGSDNVFLGYFTGSAVKAANNCVYIGRYAGRYNDLAADNNIAIGEEAQYYLSGTGNISIGYQTLWSNNGNDTWDRNIAIGYQAGFSIKSNYNIFIGDYAGYYESDDNKFYLGNQQKTSEITNRAGALMYGVMSATTTEQTLQINANLKTKGRIDEITTITADYSATIADYSIEVDATSSAIEIEFPEPSTDNHGLRFELDIYNDTNTITLIAYSNIFFNVDTITSIGTPANTWRYTMGSSSDLSGISVSDKIKITNSTNAANDGIFEVTAVNDTTDYIEVINASGVAEASDSPSTIQETVFTDSTFSTGNFKTYRAYQNRNTYKRIN